MQGKSTRTATGEADESRISVVLVPLGSEILEQTWELYRKNSSTLGFLPRGALEEFARSENVLAAVLENEVLGYAAWRHARGDAVLVHFCIAEEHRGSGCSEKILAELISRCRNDHSIRLRCRADYDHANKLWPRFGFLYQGEVVGRGSDQHPLYLWRRPNQSDAPILQAIKAATPLASRLVAIDANVFFDMMLDDSPHHLESSSLIANWVDEPEVCVTSELRNEIARNTDKEKREKTFRYMRRFEELSADHNAVIEAVSVISRVLPDEIDASDESDRRQLAVAWEGGASIFATRDEVLLDHAEDLRAVTGLRVLRPSDAVIYLNSESRGGDYFPVRLRGTDVEQRPPRSEEELYPFQNFVAREPKADWLRIIRGALTTPSVKVTVTAERGCTPRVAMALDRSAERKIQISFLRSLSGPLTGTLLQTLVAEVIEAAREESRRTISVEGPISREAERALLALNFTKTGAGGFERYLVSETIACDSVMRAISELVPEAVIDPAACIGDIEARFSPLKVVGADTPCYIIPIHKYWAASLFEKKLASADLFDVPTRPALALENVYYSASNINIPAGSRLLWYVSGEIGEVRAASSCLGTDRDSAAELSRRYHRLGAYEWRDIIAASKGDPQGLLHAYRFERTELFKKPVPWNRLKILMAEYTEKRNQLQSPVRVSEDLYFAIYREGMGVSK